MTSSQNALDQGGQRTGSVAHHTNDLTTVQNNVLAELNTGQFSGAALGHVQAILSDITTAISAANASVSSGRQHGTQNKRSAPANSSIINTVKTDLVLANPAAQNGDRTNRGARGCPRRYDGGNGAGRQFGGDHQSGGGRRRRARHRSTRTSMLRSAEMEALIAENPDLFVGLTVEDADEIVQQIQLELSHINKGGVPPAAAQDSSGDITDIVPGDINLASMAAQGQPNSPGQQAVNIAGTSETQASPQVAAIAIDDVPVTIVTTEAPTVVVDHSNSGTPELAHHLHHTWG